MCDEEIDLYQQQCEKCGYKWPLDDDPLIVCPQCKHREKVVLRGTRNKGKYVKVADLGKELGKHSWCSRCRCFTKNVPGTTYLHQPLSDPAQPYITSLYSSKNEYHPYYDALREAYQVLCHNDVDWKLRSDFYDKYIKALEARVPTLDQLQRRFYGCEHCGSEKFWAWGYHCPRCDYPEHWVLEYTEAVYNYGKAMEYGGNPLDWDELWKCQACGYEYWISNSNC